MPCNSHDGQMVYSGTTHVGHCRMPKIVESEPLNSSPTTRGLERRLDRLDRFHVDQENMRLIQMHDLIQGLQLEGQVSSKWNKPRIVSLSVPSF